MVEEQVQRELLSIYESYPGIITPSSEAPGSHVHLGVDGANEHIVAMSFEKSNEGRSAELVVDFIMNREGAKRDAGLACDCYAQGTVFYGCTQEQLGSFRRYLNYGSHRPMGRARPKTMQSSTPLSVLLSHAFTAFTDDYNKTTSGGRIKPHMGVWSNVLRWIGDEGLDQRELGKLAILSRRALRVAVRNVEEQGWLTVEQMHETRGAKVLRLTSEGRQARGIGESLIDEAEQGWRSRFGNGRVDKLRSSLAALAGQFEIELPYYLTGYGTADLQVTGGAYFPEQPGPPRIPAHGQDWPVVIRDPDSDVANLPLPALLSQVLAAFTIDYERERLGWLAIASRFLQLVDAEGATLGQLQEIEGFAADTSLKYWVNGSGKPLLERHLIVVVEPGKPRDMNRRVYLTPKGRRMRGSYPHAVMEIERNWESLYGAGHVTNIRTTLEAFDSTFARALPDYPNNTAWLSRWKWQSGVL
jgi:DNA-binding MarR family transcriptional regulator|tara:strand:+ start:5239 stop:6654 length:1416 start_codon:yes stop_codon:yes gene_type:complete